MTWTLTRSGRTFDLRQALEWSKTARGGIQYDLMIESHAQSCSSSYGLCDSVSEQKVTQGAE